MSEIFVSPEWVTENDATVVDVRREGEYEDEHLPGAVHLPFEQFRDPTDETPGKLPTATDFASLLAGVGITVGDHLVAYDGDYGVYASRFLVTAEVFGHARDRLHLLDGDVESWTRHRETTAAVPETESSDYTCDRTDGPLVSAAELEDAIEGDAVVVDTRDPIEYDTVHLPGAVNFQWQELVDDQRRRLKPREELNSVLEANGMTDDRPVRLYCNTARRLSFVYAVLQNLGYEDVAFYEGGIDDWADFGGPVDTTSS